MCEMPQLNNFCKAVCFLLRFFQVSELSQRLLSRLFANRNTLIACQGAALRLSDLSVSEQMHVPSKGRADGFGCGLLCKPNACVWIQLLRKVNLPSWFGEITYWLTYCCCLKTQNR